MKKTVRVTIDVEVTIDESKFDEKMMREFIEDFYNFPYIEDHIKFLAQLEARELAGEFIEGYGNVSEYGIELMVVDQEEKIID